MTNRVTPWPFFIHYRPEEAEKRIREAYQEAGTVSGAAELLGISERHLYRFCTALKLRLGDMRAQVRRRKDDRRELS